jgi:hypothetical protein
MVKYTRFLLLCMLAEKSYYGISGLCYLFISYPLGRLAGI